MENNYNLIEDYLNGALKGPRLHLFEKELKQNPDLQKALIRKGLNADAPQNPGEEKILALAENIRKEFSDEQPPRLSLADRLKFSFLEISFWMKLISVIAVIAAVWLIWPNLFSPEQLEQEQLRELMIDPYCPGVAGASGAGEDKIFYGAALFYCEIKPGGLDSLERIEAGCAGFCMAAYYLAHWRLREGQYPAAARDFEACLDNSAQLKAFYNTSDLSKIRFNLILTELGRGGSKQQARSALKSLLKDDDAAQEVKDKAAELLRRI